MVVVVVVPIAFYVSNRRVLTAPLAALITLPLLWPAGANVYPGELNHPLAVLGGIGSAAALNRGRRADGLLAASLTFALASTSCGIAVATACLVHNLVFGAWWRRWVATVLPLGRMAAVVGVLLGPARWRLRTTHHQCRRGIRLGPRVQVLRGRRPRQLGRGDRAHARLRHPGGIDAAGRAARGGEPARVDDRGTGLGRRPGPHPMVLGRHRVNPFPVPVAHRVLLVARGHPTSAGQVAGRVGRSGSTGAGPWRSPQRCWWSSAHGRWWCAQTFRSPPDGSRSTGRRAAAKHALGLVPEVIPANQDLGFLYGDLTASEARDLIEHYGYPFDRDLAQADRAMEVNGSQRSFAAGGGRRCSASR